ncbi:hypothetical protein [Demequina sp. NBRC 110053]|uniref:hypothetical protein n=1 Tax=Demequina sp. NBRC 110053 TaxID=1570342 RepID=UPI001186B29B|nr:hypothetical protein [Demequina sp. NBRC 110053]
MSRLQNTISFSHLNVGVSAAMKGAGLSVSYSGSIPEYSWPVKRNANAVAGSLRLCNSDRWYYVHSTGIATINGSPLIVQAKALAL